MQFYNYIVPKVSSTLDQGHILADSLRDKINNHDGSEAYHSLFDMEERPDFKGYLGICRPVSGHFIFDFDSLDLEEARRDAIKLVTSLKLQQAWFFFSGSKGFHVYVDAAFFNVPIDMNTALRFASIVTKLKSDLKLSTLDDGIVQANRKFRMPNSKHPKTGLFKTQIGWTEMNELSIDAIKEKAKTRGPVYFELVHEDHFYIDPTLFGPHPVVDPSAEALLPQFGHDNVIEEDISNGKLFKEFKKKVCVSRMWEAELQEGERHAVASILISDLYHTGAKRGEALLRMEEWAKKQGIADRFEKEFVRMINEQYSGQRDYSYGCYHNIKKKFCSGTCELYTKLSKEKRAEVLDIPAKAQKILDEQDKPGERKLTQEILDSFQGKIIKQDKDVFLFKETHWVEASQREIDAIKEMIFQRLGRRAKSKDMKSAYETFLHAIPAVPEHVNMFEPNPDAANFLNGTLWVKRVKGEYTLKFEHHNQDDYLTTCLAVNYTPHAGGLPNHRFNEFLNHLLQNDSEREEKLRAMKQVAGAMLMPRFPQIFFFLGESGSGKSTFVKLFFRLIGGTKVSGFVQPCDMHGFHLEGLIHKTINIHTDVNEHKPIPDEFFKSSGDRIPMQINRKGRKVVQSFLPAVHVFCANTLPPTQVKNQNVYDRRMTIIKLDHVVEKRIDQFEDLVFEENTQALIEFALEGVRDIVGLGGFYTKPESSKGLTKAWQEMSADPIQDFIDDVNHDEVSGLKVDPEANLKRSVVFDKFSQWSIDIGLKQAATTRGKFYRELGARGFRLKKLKDGTRVIEGFAESKSNGSSAVPSQF